ncbi:hypothetical protein KIN20_034927 [Parelaphostrongylus tenuis]|uniref:Uncharacterized protein n=1 Tax=Parelaphostrongylus tenuis TaxID=148309 RepID=A0AAD5RAE7_PARTN|nr:hypothetical protein KIN20_034927 [Parelaphostrongylus tenuis]
MKATFFVITAALLMNQVRADINMFNEYFKRGMYDCALDYLKNIQEIHHLFQKASAEQQKCRVKAANTDKSFPLTKIAPLDEYIEKMRREEEDAIGKSITDRV